MSLKNKKNTNSDSTLQKITQLESQAAELNDKLLRSLADYANLEKRIESQRQLFITLTATAIVGRMIEVLDDLYLAQEHLNDPGLKIAIDKFLNILKSEGLEEVVATAQPFSPEKMECIATASGPKNQVISVKKRGYLLNDQLLRPAQVIVGQEEVVN